MTWTHGENRQLALEAERVDKRFGSTTALDGVSLSVAEGACTALVGESGCGKTTLLRCFNRTLDPDRGTVRRHGEDVRDLDPILLRRRTGFVQQEGGLLPHWKVLRNAAMVPRLNGQPDAAERARWSLDLVGLPADRYGDRWPAELSGGQRQRVAIARALAARPDVLLMDEPFGALDAITRTDLHETFQQLRSELGVTVLLVTHDLHEAFALADSVAVLRAGRVEQEAPPHHLARAPATDYVARLLARARLETST
jgi:osmoprotectant transport system ATP-binding protein